MKNAYLNNLKIHDNSQNIGFWLKPNIQGLEMPDIRLPNFVRPNIDGAFVPNHLYGGRAITLEGKVSGSGTLTTYRTRRRQLEDAVKIYRPGGELTPITFKFKTMDNLELQAEVYTKKLKFADRLLMAGDYTLDLFAPDIRLVSQTLKQQQLNIFEGGGFAIPTGIPLDISAGGTTETPIENLGNISSFPTIIVYGTIEDPTVSNETTGESFSLNYTLTSADERIEIDIEGRTVLYFATATATGTNIRQYFSGDWFDLEPGNNTIKLVVADITDTGYMFIQWRDAFIGV
jgi:hypothetical protein